MPLRPNAQGILSHSTFGGGGAAEGTGGGAKRHSTSGMWAAKRSSSIAKTFSAAGFVGLVGTAHPSGPLGPLVGQSNREALTSLNELSASKSGGAPSFPNPVRLNQSASKILDSALSVARGAGQSKRESGGSGVGSFRRTAVVPANGTTAADGSTLGLALGAIDETSWARAERTSTVSGKGRSRQPLGSVLSPRGSQSGARHSGLGSQHQQHPWTNDDHHPRVSDMGRAAVQPLPRSSFAGVSRGASWRSRRSDAGAPGSWSGQAGSMAPQLARSKTLETAVAALGSIHAHNDLETMTTGEGADDHFGDPLWGAANSLADLMPFVSGFVQQSLLDAVRRSRPSAFALDLEPSLSTFSAAVMIVDITGFTALTERLAARPGTSGIDILIASICDYFSSCLEVIETFGGTVVKLAGDSMIVVFSTGAAVGDDVDLPSHVIRATFCAERLCKDLGSVRMLPQGRIETIAMSGRPIENQDLVPAGAGALSQAASRVGGTDCPPIALTSVVSEVAGPGRNRLSSLASDLASTNVLSVSSLNRPSLTKIGTMRPSEAAVQGHIQSTTLVDQLASAENDSGLAGTGSFPVFGADESGAGEPRLKIKVMVSCGMLSHCKVGTRSSNGRHHFEAFVMDPPGQPPADGRHVFSQLADLDKFATVEFAIVSREVKAVLRDAATLEAVDGGDGRVFRILAQATSMERALQEVSQDAIHGLPTRLSNASEEGARSASRTPQRSVSGDVAGNVKQTSQRSEQSRATSGDVGFQGDAGQRTRRITFKVDPGGESGEPAVQPASALRHRTSAALRAQVAALSTQQSSLLIGAVRQLLPDIVFERISMDQGDFLNEIRTCTCLFLGLSGLAEKIAAIDPSAPDVNSVALRAVRNHFHAVYRVVEELDGTFLQLRQCEKGFVAIAAFGLPNRAHVNDIERGVRAAVTIRNQLQKHLKSKCTIGVCSGRLLCATAGGPGRYLEYTVFGNSINLAARLCVHAGLLGAERDDGTSLILVDEFTAQASASVADLRPLPEHLAIKGRAERVPIYEVVSMGSNATVLQAPDSLLGRDNILQRIRLTVDNFNSTEVGGAIIIVGGKGVGKTAVLSEGQRMLTGEDTIKLRTRAQRGYGEVGVRTLLSWAPLLRQLFVHPTVVDHGERSSLFFRKVAALVPNFSEVMQSIAFHLGLPKKLFRLPNESSKSGGGVGQLSHQIMQSNVSSFESRNRGASAFTTSAGTGTSVVPSGSSQQHIAGIIPTRGRGIPEGKSAVEPAARGAKQSGRGLGSGLDPVPAAAHGDAGDGASVSNNGSTALRRSLTTRDERRSRLSRRSRRFYQSASESDEEEPFATARDVVPKRRRSLRNLIVGGYRHAKIKGTTALELDTDVSARFGRSSTMRASIRATPRKPAPRREVSGPLPSALQQARQEEEEASEPGRSAAESGGRGSGASVRQSAGSLVSLWTDNSGEKRRTFDGGRRTVGLNYANLAGAPETGAVRKQMARRRSQDEGGGVSADSGAESGVSNAARTRSQGSETDADGIATRNSSKRSASSRVSATSRASRVSRLILDRERGISTPRGTPSHVTDASDTVTPLNEALAIDVLAKVFRAASTTVGKLVITFDDAHEADPASWQLLERICFECEGVLALVGVDPSADVSDMCRDSFSSIVAADRTQVYQLESLSKDHVADLARQICGDMVATSLIDAIYEHSRGHPLLTVQLLRFLERLTDEEQTRYVSALAGAKDQDVALASVVAQSIDKLPPTRQLTLKVASLIGELVPLNLLMAVHPLHSSPAAVQVDVEQLVADNFLVWVDTGSRAEAQFTARALREVAMSMIPGLQSARLHGDIARWLDTAETRTSLRTSSVGPSGDLSLSNPSVVADHYTRSLAHVDATLRARFLRAASLWEEAAAQAVQVGGYIQALGFLERAELVAEGAPSEKALAGGNPVGPGDVGSVPEDARSVEVREAAWSRIAARAYLGLGDVAAAVVALEMGLGALGVTVVWPRKHFLLRTTLICCWRSPRVDPGGPAMNIPRRSLGEFPAELIRMAAMLSQADLAPLADVLVSDIVEHLCKRILEDGGDGDEATESLDVLLAHAEDLQSELRGRGDRVL